jgi:hypothetical protein
VQAAGERRLLRERKDLPELVLLGALTPLKEHMRLKPD